MIAASVAPDPPQSFAEKNWRALLAIVIIIAAALRIYSLDVGLWYDESTSIWALEYVDTKLTFLRAEETRLIPLNTVLLFVWYRIVEAIPGVEMGSRMSDALLHVLPATFSLVAVPLLFTLTRYLTGSVAAGLAAAFLAAISPFHMYYASELGPHSLYACMVLAAAYYNVRALEENRRAFWIGTVVFEALAFYAYYFSAFYLVAVNLFVLVNFRRYRPVFPLWIGCQVMAFLLVLPAIALALQVFGVHNAAQEHWFPYPTLKTLALTVKDWFAGYSPRAVVYWPLFLIGMALFAAGAWSLRSKPRSLMFLLFAGFLPLVMQWAFWNTQSFSFYTMRIQLAYSLPAFALAGAGLAALRSQIAHLAALVLLTGFTTPALLDFYRHEFHPIVEHRLGARYKIDNRGAAEFIREHWQPGDVVAHASTVTLGPFKYHYLRNAEQSFVGFGQEEWEAHLRNYPEVEVWESIGFVPQRIDDFTATAPRVWLASAGWEWRDEFTIGVELREWLDAQGVRIAEWHAPGLNVYLFDFARAAAGPVDVNRTADWGWYSALDVPAIPSPPFRFPDPLDPAALDISFEPLDGTRYAGPDTANGAARFNLHLRNRSAETRPIGLTVRGAAEFQSAMALDREPGVEAWRPVHGHFGKVSYLARLSDARPSATLSGPIYVFGENELYIESESLAPDRHPGALRVEARDVLGRIHPIGHIAAGGEPGWGWRHVGRIPELQNGAVLILTAENTQGGAEAYVHIDKIAFVPASADGAAWTPLMESSTELAPFGDQTTELTFNAGNSRALLFEFVDTRFNVYRSLLWHAGAAPVAGDTP